MFIEKGPLEPAHEHRVEGGVLVELLVDVTHHVLAVPGLTDQRRHERIELGAIRWLVVRRQDQGVEVGACSESLKRGRLAADAT
jgi:intracellular sulfur oxidation DsrE/DsrF family protein